MWIKLVTSFQNTASLSNKIARRLSLRSCIDTALLLLHSRIALYKKTGTMQVVANWADAVLAMIELLPASGKLAQGKLRFLSRKFRPDAVVGMVAYHLTE